jgi:hypothetical protein
MTLLAKYWEAKLIAVCTSVAGLVAIWAVLAWPDWTAASSDEVARDELIGALQYLAATAPAELPPDEVPETVQRVVVVTRKPPPQQIVVVQEGEAGSAGTDALLPITVPAAPPPAATPPTRAPVPTPVRAPAQPPASSAPPPPPPPKPKVAPAPTQSKGS